MTDLARSWLQLGELGLAFLLSALVGLEREWRQKSAGLRTYTLVGVSAALFMLVSKYGFDDVIVPNRVMLDPSRVAAQIVTGIGFIGGGVIFMRRDAVRGLTTAASVWLTAALGTACGAGLLLLAVATTAAHFVIMLGFPLIVRRLPRERRSVNRLSIAYEDGRGLLRQILVACTALRFTVSHVELVRDGRAVDAEARLDRADGEGTAPPPAAHDAVVLTMRVKGSRPVAHLLARLGDLAGVLHVTVGEEVGDLE